MATDVSALKYLMLAAVSCFALAARTEAGFISLNHPIPQSIEIEKSTFGSGSATAPNAPRLQLPSDSDQSPVPTLADSDNQNDESSPYGDDGMSGTSVEMPAPGAHAMVSTTVVQDSPVLIQRLFLNETQCTPETDPSSTFRPPRIML